jgi:actin-related protein
MFDKFQVSSFYLALQQVLSLYASGKTTGVVVDSGYELTSTVPIYEGFALSHAIQKINLSGVHLTDYLMSLMKDDGVLFSNIEENAKYNAKDTK